ncbi:putative zinc finger protein [Schistosoma mansoni]|uniref:putative zinc finger protein n=1 Tax=Schistosoma mansoni TaxID=6183 RepID=UPI00022DC425|nr:putative zinc finger protein [Schistosoma mansoni]|eukprot:XP_018651747.1 putative zinc finger protein [Schistosoma mansoni]
MNSLKRARLDSNQTDNNNNNIDNKSLLPNQFTCPCGRIMLDSSEFMEHACQCHEFMMTASNFAEVIAKNTAMVMSSEWNKCFQSANLNNFSINRVHNNDNSNDNNILIKNNVNNKANSNISVLCKHFELEHDNVGQFTCTKCNESYDQLVYYLKHQLFDNCLNSYDCFDQFSSSATISNTNNVITTNTSSSSVKTMITSTNTDSIMPSNKKLVCNACHQTGFQHTGELINHLTECPKFISFTGNIGNIIGSTIAGGSNTTNTSASNITDTISHSNSNNMSSLNLHMKNTQTPSTINQSQQYNHGSCVSPLLNGLINSSTFDFEKNFNDLLKSSCGSSTIHNYLSNNNNNHFSLSSRFSSNSTLSDNIDSSNNHKNINLCSPYPSHGTNSQNSYSHFLSNLQSLGKSYYNDTTKSSSSTLSLDNSIDSPMIELNLSNNDTYNCTTSVNSLHMSEFNTNSHPTSLYHGHMKDLKMDHHHDQHHRQSHQSQQNNSVNNLPPTPTTTSIENITDLSRPFKCCHCIKAFKSKALLDQHMHIHYPPKYTCRYCAKKYRWPPVFYHHQRTCKKRPTTSTACTSNDINNTTITVTMSTNTAHNNQHSNNNSCNSSMKRNHHHHHHHNLNYPDIRKNFPITSDSLTSLRSINSQINDTFYNSLTSLRNSNGNLGGNEAISSYGHSLCLPPFNSNSSTSLMELSNNSNMFHNNSNNNISDNNNDDDVSLMPPPHLNNFTALAAAAAAAAAMNMNDIQRSELQELPCEIPKNHLSSPIPTSSLQISSSPIIDNNFNNSPENNIHSISTTITTLVNSPKSCYHCGKEFSSRLSLKQHVEGKHSTEGKYCCPGCSKRYRWGASYYYHKKSCPAVREQSPVSNGQKDEFKNDSNNSLKFRISHKKYLRSSSRNSDLSRNSMKESHSNKNDNLNNTSSIQSKFIKHQIQSKQICQTIKDDSLICDINAFPLHIVAGTSSVEQ